MLASKWKEIRVQTEIRPNCKCESYMRYIAKCKRSVILTICPESLLNSSPPSAAYMRQWTGSTLVQVMACRLLGAKPLPEPMLTYCQLDSWVQISVKFESKFYHFHSWKGISKCRLPNCQPFFSGRDELTHLSCGQNGLHFADGIFRCIFVNGKFCILIKISLKFVTNVPTNNNSALV